MGNVLPFKPRKQMPRIERIAYVVLGACVGFLVSRKEPEEIRDIVEHSMHVARVALGKE